MVSAVPRKTEGDPAARKCTTEFTLAADLQAVPRIHS